MHLIVLLCCGAGGVAEGPLHHGGCAAHQGVILHQLGCEVDGLVSHRESASYRDR